MRYLLIIWATLYLTACSRLPQIQTLPPLANVEQWQITEHHTNAENSQTLLVIEPQNQAWRWIRTNALGVPITRQILSQKQWQMDGFLPPDNASRRLFISMIPLVAPQSWQASLPKIHATHNANTTTYSQGKTILWTTTQQAQHTIIHFPDGQVYTVHLLN